MESQILCSKKFKSQYSAKRICHMAEIKICVGPSWLDLFLKVIWFSPRRFGYWGGGDRTKSATVPCRLPTGTPVNASQKSSTEERHIYCIPKSILPSKSGVPVQNLISGSRPAKLEQQSEFFLSVV